MKIRLRMRAWPRRSRRSNRNDVFPSADITTATVYPEENNVAANAINRPSEGQAAPAVPRNFGPVMNKSQKGVGCRRKSLRNRPRQRTLPKPLPPQVLAQRLKVHRIRRGIPSHGYKPPPCTSTRIRRKR